VENKVISLEERAQDGAKSYLEELLREGARKLLQEAIESEVAEYLEEHRGRRTDAGAPMPANGRVTLESSVGIEWQYQKILAESAVKGLKGVVGITNKIEVKPQVSPQEAKSQIEQALRRSADLDARRSLKT
jgi:osmotically-inducible protein OsmY